MKVKLKHDLWHGDYTLALDLPDRWKVEVLRMEGDKKPVLPKSRLREAVQAFYPILKGKKEICVLFDDLTRQTKVSEFAPYLLELFEQCGIRDEQVRFLCALGTHAPHDNVALRKKLGHEILERFPVYNHNPYEHCTDLGRTKLGTPVLVNKEYVACDARIGIGTFQPHMFCGFGGGYKIIMPGISHMDVMVHHHGTLLNQHWDFFGLGRYQGNPLLEDLIEYGRIARLDGKIDVLVNTEADVTDVYGGDPDRLYPYMLERAPSHYSTTAPGKADIVFANAYCKGNEASIGLSTSECFLKDEGGDVVVLCNIDEGQVVHYLLGRFGNGSWGQLAFGERKKDPRAKRIFIYSKYKDLANSFWFGERADLFWYSDLNKLVERLADDYKDRETTAFVLPDATIQMIVP
jgi:nickel-dependent lactate racemase